MPTLNWIGKDKVLNHHNVFILIRRTIQVKKTGCTMIMLTMNK